MGNRLQARRDDAEKRALVRLTLSYLAVFALVIVALSFVAYAFLDSTYRSIVAPALDTPEGRAGFSAAMRAAILAIVLADVLLLCIVGVASFALAQAALAPLSVAREREERFSADVAHELRTPLAAIASLADAASMGEVDAAPAALRNIARRALESGELVGDLLTLARVSDAESLDCEPVDLAIVTQRVIREHAGSSDAVVLEGTFESAIVLGDERRLRQLVRNLLDNAYAHARKRVAASVTALGGEARLIVEDDGPGVDPEVVPHLFERFAKGHASTGSGLGLAICRWVARAHAGEIEYAGNARFIVRIPSARNLKDLS